jgi:prepilin-type processing-associated H-X9-DG protein
MCTNNLKQIALALRNYEDVHGAFPPACTVDAAGRRLHSWRTLILPYLEADQLYRSIDLSKPWDDPANARALEAMPSTFRCPTAAGPKYVTTYLANAAAGGFLVPGKPRRLAEITDPLSSTLMVIEADDARAVPWMAPIDADESLILSLVPETKFQHAGGMNVGLVDGSVRFLKASVTAPVRRALISISGKDTPSQDDW